MALYIQAFSMVLNPYWTVSFCLSCFMYQSQLSIELIILIYQYRNMYL